jgi:hypothetical protein
MKKALAIIALAAVCALSSMGPPGFEPSCKPARSV